MIAPPNATSHGLGATTGAAIFADLTGISAANTGAVDSISAATADNTTFFMDPAPSSVRSHCRSIFSLTATRGFYRLNRTPQLASADKFHCAWQSGKQKSRATAAFLGESCRYQQSAATNR